MRALRIFWAFSRPHTIIGSVVSITTLFLLAVPPENYPRYMSELLLTLVAGLACNVFIVGLNQVIDVELDKLNKPYLPLANGSMTVDFAKKILFVCLVISLTTSFSTSRILGMLILVILLIGIVYSVPPIQLKRHHLPAALSITGVRGILVNLGMFLHFTTLSDSTRTLSWQPLWILTLFVTVFSLSIAWFKDLPDVEGDRKFQFQTAPVLYSVRTVFYTGSILLMAAYGITLFWAWTEGDHFLMVSHGLAALVFLWMVVITLPDSKVSVARFYKYFWGLFFWEYVLFGLWAII